MTTKTRGQPIQISNTFLYQTIDKLQEEINESKRTYMPRKKFSFKSAKIRSGQSQVQRKKKKKKSPTSLGVAAVEKGLDPSFSFRNRRGL